MRPRWEGHASRQSGAWGKVLAVPVGRGGLHFTSGAVKVSLIISVPHWISVVEGCLVEGNLRVTVIGSHVRYGAFLRCIPPERRVGDYAHGASRILNAVFKRLETAAPAWGPHARANLRSGWMWRMV